MNIDMDGSFLDPAMGELERAVLAEERAEKAEARVAELEGLCGDVGREASAQYRPTDFFVPIRLVLRCQAAGRGEAVEGGK